MINAKHRELVAIPRFPGMEKGKQITRGANVFSSNGEDGILANIFSQIVPLNKICIELYSANGQKNSLSRNIIVNHGWSAFLLENNEDIFEDLKELYADKDAVITLCKTVVSLDEHESIADNRIKLDHVDELPDQCDLLIIDVGGLEYHIWDSLTRIQPRVVACRFNLTMHNNLDFVQEEHPSVHHGNSFRAFVRLAMLKNYDIFECSRDYAFFVRSDLFHLAGMPRETCLDNLRCPNIHTMFASWTPSNDVLLTGNTRLCFTSYDVPLREDEITVVPKALRL